MPSGYEDERIALARATSLVLGWTYFICWSLSFYPQPVQNFRRKATSGLSADFPLANLLGFSSYTIYTSALLFSPLIRGQYAARYPRGGEPSVRFNDFIFALHGTVMIVIVYSQFSTRLWGFYVESSQTASRSIIAVCSLAVAGILAIMLQAAAQGLLAGVGPHEWPWIDVVYAFGDVKLFLTVVKYLPQLRYNYKRKNTAGFSIEAVLLDFLGGVLSLVQLLMDSLLEEDWSASIVGNPAKWALGNITLFFDIAFIAQHYLIYRDAAYVDIPSPVASGGDDETQPLLGS